MIAIVLAAAAAPPALPAKAEPTVDPARWVLPTDIPASETAKATVTTFDLTIDQSGQPIGCSIVIPSGSDILDKSLCAALVKRARFKPARDASAQPLPSVRRDRVIWLPEATGDNYWYKAPDFIVESPLLTGARTKTVSVVELINSAGRIESCQISHSSKNAEVDAKACQVVGLAGVSPPITDAQNTTVRGIRSFTIGFEAGSGTRVVMR